MKSPRREPMPLGDGPDAQAARMLGLALEPFRALLPRLYARGFPTPDPDTELFDLDAVNQWRRRRHPGLYPLSPDRPSAPAETDVMVRQRLRALYG